MVDGDAILLLVKWQFIWFTELCAGAKEKGMRKPFMEELVLSACLKNTLFQAYLNVSL